MPRSHRSKRRTTRPRWPWWLALAVVLLLALLATVGTLGRKWAPRGNTNRARYDAIIVLGTPSDDDGNPTPAQLARVTEAVAEYQRGVAPRLILSGAAAHNSFVESQGMARTAASMGIPADALFEEPHALDTIQNACYSIEIMHRHGWRSAEVISSAAHLPRAGLIFSGATVDWRLHAAPPVVPPSAIYRSAEQAVETFKTARYLLWAHWRESCPADLVR